MNTTRDLLFSRDEWGFQYVNQESKWDDHDTTQPVIDVDPMAGSIRQNVNNLEMNTTRDLFSRDEWGFQYVNQESKWDDHDTTQPVIDVDPMAGSIRQNVNNLEMNTTRDLFSRDEWGFQYVNQESKWDDHDTTEPVIDVDPMAASIRPNVNNGTELWKANLSKPVIDVDPMAASISPNVINGTELWKANLRNGGPGPSSKWNDPREICTGGKTFDMKLDPRVEQDEETRELYMRKPWLGTPSVGDEPFTTEQLRSMSTSHLLRLQSRRDISNENRKQSGGPSDQIEADAQITVHHDDAGRVNTLDERPTMNCEDKNAVNEMDVGASTTTSSTSPLSAILHKMDSDFRNFMKRFF